MPGLNDRAWCLVKKACADRARLRIDMIRLECGSLVLDMGLQAKGGLDAGMVMAEIGMAGLGNSRAELGVLFGLPWNWVVTGTSYPLEGCFLSQAAIWPVEVADYHAMGSGPGCLLNLRLGVASKYDYEERSEHAMLVLEADRIPDDAVCRRLTEECEIEAGRLAVLAAATSSAAGRTQIAARSIETVLHKLAHLDFEPRARRSREWERWLALQAADDLEAMGLTNDMPIFGSQVWLEVRGAGDLGSPTRAGGNNDPAWLQNRSNAQPAIPLPGWFGRSPLR